MSIPTERYLSWEIYILPIIFHEMMGWGGGLIGTLRLEGGLSLSNVISQSIIGLYQNNYYEKVWEGGGEGLSYLSYLYSESLLLLKIRPNNVFIFPGNFCVIQTEEQFIFY